MTGRTHEKAGRKTGTVPPDTHAFFSIRPNRIVFSIITDTVQAIRSYTTIVQAQAYLDHFT